MRLSDEIRAFLNERRFAVLATLDPDGSPQQSVMWYRLDGDTILMNTLRGRRKDRNLRHDNRASICVEDEYRWVAIEGRIELDDDQAAAQPGIKALATRYDGPEEAERLMRTRFGSQHRVNLRMSIGRVLSEGFES